MPFEPWHLRWLHLQPTQAALSSMLTLEHGEAIAKAGPCFSAFVGQEVIACAGIIHFWPGRAQVWSLLSESMPLYYRVIHRAVKGFLQDYPMTRLECIVDPRHEAAMRWADHLGFTRESLMKGYDPQGHDQWMYVRVTRE